jgi:parallel beta-helix repeat protein
MSGGTITGNTANNGGGVYHGSSPYTNRIFTMSGGTISGNTAKENGGGIFVNGDSRFTKTGGTITGYNSDQTNGNAVRDEDGNILARRGHAVWVSPFMFRREGIRKETTSGLKDNLSYDPLKDSTGAWDR